MKKYLRLNINYRILLIIVLVILPTAFGIAYSSQQASSDENQSIYNASNSQITEIFRQKQSLTPEQKKIDSNLLQTIQEINEQVSNSPTLDSNIFQNLSTSMLQISNECAIKVKLTVSGNLSDEQLSQLKALGMNIEITLLEYAILEGDLPYDAVETVAGLDFVKHVGTPGYPIHNTGIVTSAGDSVLRADLARSTFGIDGGGSKIGVLSDGVDHLVNSIASGDLPSGVQILKGGSGDEGTAMLEIIHDLAPGADLAFYSPASSSDMIVGISALESAGCNIIVDDITFLDEPKFEDGPIAQRARQFVNDGGVYVTSAGNSRLRHYNNTYNPIYYASFDLNVHDYNLGIGQDIGNTFTIPNGYGIIAILQWNNERGTSPMDDFDFYLFNSTFNTILAGSDNDQEGGYPNPWEGFQYINDTGSTVTVNLVVTEWNLVSAPASVMLDYHVYYCPSTLQYNTTADSVIGHSAVEEVLSTAAVDAATPGTLESYSSCGPGTVYFPSYEQRQVPNITGVDGVQTRTGQLGYFSNPFYGTSAAAPHIAAIAALVWDANPTLNSSQIRNAITSTAVDLSTTGFDYYSGWGRADAYTAVDSVARKLNIFSSDGGTVTTPGIGYFGPYTYGEVVSIVATPDSCYHFLEWTGDTATIANVSSSSTTITMNDRYSITANFAAAPFSSGDGNPDNPYLIQDVCALQSIRNNLNAHYALVKDIDASATTVWNNGKGFNPIGDNISPFTGNFDGRGYTITGLHINRSTTDYVGLFGYIDSGGVVTNASLANVNITGYKHVGGLIGHINWGSVSNTYATGNVNGDSYAGGLVGYDHQSPIRNSYFLGNVRGTEDIGGLIGYLSNCLVSDSSSSGNVSGSSIIGGLVGKNQLGTVDNSYTTGHVNGTSTVGGLIGSNAGQVNKSYTTANVSATDQEAGGLIGNHLGTVRNSYATGYVSGTNIVGGLIGYNTFAGLVYYSYSTGQVSGTSASGGLIGYKASLIPVSDGFWDIETSGQSSSAGGIGKNTAEMKDFSTFLNAGWDLICESDNGTDDIWGIDQSGADNNGYPFLSWQGLTHNVSFTLAYSAGADGSINGSSLQTVNCSESGSSVEAIPDACYHFVNWSDSSTQNPRTDTSVKEDITVTANFAIDTFTLTYNAGASGSITGDTPQAVDCGSSGSAVTAVPNDCYHFVNWSDLSTDNPRTDTNVQGDITVTANFAPTGATHTLMINSSAYGNVTTPDEGSSGPYNCGDVIDLIAEADTDYAFHNWEGDVETIGNSRSSITTITMYGNYSITANFGLPPTGFYGDANRDGLLSLADYSAVQLMRFGKRPFNPGGDANCDGLLSLSDYSAVQLMRFGKRPIVDKYEVSYDFLSGADSNKWAKSKTIASTPPADNYDNESGWTNATAGNYDDIALTDDNVWTITGASGLYSALQCKFTVVNNPADITSIGVTLTGSSSIDASTLRFYAWNFDTESWTQIGSDFSITTSIASYSSWTAWGKVYADYIDGSQYMYILAVLNTANANLNVDYIKLTVAH